MTPRKPSLKEIRKLHAALDETIAAFIASRKLYRKAFSQADRCYRMLVARRDPAYKQELADIKELLDVLRPKTRKRR